MSGGQDRRDESLEARYANYLSVGNNSFEFLLDFGQFYPERDAPLVHTRIVTSPAYAKAFHKTIVESLDRYEQTYGPIGEPDDEEPAR